MSLVRAIPMLVMGSIAGCFDRDVAIPAAECRAGVACVQSPVATPSIAVAASPSARTPLPCDVQQELSTHCWTCHGEPLQFTAPMKLMSVQDFQQPAPSDHIITVAESARSRIHDPLRPMPPAPLPTLDSTELMKLDAWLGASELIAGPDSCEVASAPPPSVSMATPAADGGSPADPADATRACAEVRAHGDDPTAPFTFTNAQDLYQCFEFVTPWGPDDVYGISFKPLIDNSSVLHHWLLYQHYDSVQDGSSSPCLRLYPESSLVAAWAPGTGPMIMPADVATQLPASAYTLELHYNGTGSDRSGVEVCYTHQPRTHTAAMHWLGTQSIFGTTATGVCRPTNTEPIHTLKYWPHMHLAGRHMSVTITRANGVRETWHDAPFDFQNQRLWDSDKIILPGDTITTTCTYARPSVGGEGTNEEMCYDVVLAYPVGALTQPGVGTGFSIHQCVN